MSAQEITAYSYIPSSAIDSYRQVRADRSRTLPTAVASEFEQETERRISLWNGRRKTKLTQLTDSYARSYPHIGWNIIHRFIIAREEIFADYKRDHEISTKAGFDLITNARLSKWNRWKQKKLQVDTPPKDTRTTVDQKRLLRELTKSWKGFALAALFFLCGNSYSFVIRAYDSRYAAAAAQDVMLLTNIPYCLYTAYLIYRARTDTRD